MEMTQYEISSKIRRDNQNAMNYLKAEALKDGLEQGLEQGRELRDLELIKAALDDGNSLSSIASFMRMELDELGAFTKKHNLI